MDNSIASRPINSLDEIDRFIMESLRQDGRMPFAQIAQRLNVSPGMIRMRYNRLVESGFLHVVAVSNPLRMGLNTMAMIGVCVQGNRLLEVADRIAELDEVVYLVVASGSYDLMVEVFCRDRDHLLKFLTESLYQIEGINETNSFVYLKIIKEIYF
ncbi:MAG: Lrp/AsnC family transcriptional regulator [Anaerolineales bacterium]|jgi:Lrp/AsnC family transcriptional regulator for asnA, asnC and gidA|nr:Lrp/AsnC family transcriptional regulator [Anaerolineales bacterium]